MTVWSEQYDASYDEFKPSEITILNSRKRTQGKQEFFQKEAISPLTAYTYVNVPHGKTVWFIWMNNITEENKDTLDHVVSTMKFGKNAPETLKEAFGNRFDPIPMTPPPLDNNHSISKLPTDTNLLNILAISGYKVPVTVSAGIFCGSKNCYLCPGATHVGAAANAIDIRINGKNVYAAATSTVYSAQRSNSGYGNLVKLRDTQAGYLSFYAHLAWFVIEPGLPLGQGHFIGLSGSSGTGTPPAPHLHFHVQTTGGSPISLSGMTGLSLYNYPSCGKSTCAEIEALPNKECQCGSVN